jgi:hypothetical protein
MEDVPAAFDWRLNGAYAWFETTNRLVRHKVISSLRWWFPEIGVPINHPFIDKWVFPKSWGVPPNHPFIDGFCITLW